VSDSSNTTLNALDGLIRRNIVVQAGDQLNYRARHEVIAEIVFEHLKNGGLLYEILSGLAKIAATETRPGMPRSARPMRFLIRVMNHDFLHRCLGMDRARTLYEELEPQLRSKRTFGFSEPAWSSKMGSLD